VKLVVALVIGQAPELRLLLGKTESDVRPLMRPHKDLHVHACGHGWQQIPSTYQVRSTTVSSQEGLGRGGLR
jgi:hypothetical protein